MSQFGLASKDATTRGVVLDQAVILVDKAKYDYDIAHKALCCATGAPEPPGPYAPGTAAFIEELEKGAKAAQAKLDSSSSRVLPVISTPSKDNDNGFLARVRLIAAETLLLVAGLAAWLAGFAVFTCITGTLAVCVFGLGESASGLIMLAAGLIGGGFAMSWTQSIREKIKKMLPPIPDR